MSNIFSKSQTQKTESPTGFETLPDFARKGIETSVDQARGFVNDPSIFEAASITPEQQQALGVLQQAAQPLSQEQFNQQRQIFENPFLEQTLTPALEDLQRAGQGALGDIGSQATQAGAFGGTRQALLESQLGSNLAREAGRLSSNIRSQAFDSATNRALAELSGQEASATNLFNVGEGLRQLQQQTQQAPISAVQLLASLSRGLPTGGGNVTTTNTGSSPISDIFGSALRGASSFFNPSSLEQQNVLPQTSSFGSFGQGGTSQFQPIGFRR